MLPLSSHLASKAKLAENLAADLHSPQRFANSMLSKQVLRGTTVASCAASFHTGIPPMVWPEPITLEGQFASLQPLDRSHTDALTDAAKDGELWKLWYTSVPAPEGVRAEIDRRLALQAQGSMLPFAVVDASGSIVGMTTYMNIDSVHKRVEVGSTWYAKRVHRTGINSECKLMLMTHAFETLGCIAVEYRTSALNLASRSAIERLGAKLDGVLRNHQRHSNGSLRDTYVYSIIQSEWPTVKAHLNFRLANGGSGG